MPAINVARTDTFEQQRQKINQIGTQIFDITQGGSDLATGNLRLGDGTRTSPSLAFTSDPLLGIYRSNQKTFGYVSDGKKIIDISPSGFYSYRDLILQKRTLSDSGIVLSSPGSNYESGSYSNIPLTGGSGEGATANLTVVEYLGTITNSGDGYNSGTYSTISLLGGSGNGAVASFSVANLELNITNPGSGYGLVDGDGNRTITYFSVPLTGGNGSGAAVDIFLNNNTGEVETVSVVSSGQGYEVGDTLSVNNADLDNSGSGLQLDVTKKPGVVENFQIQNFGTGYQTGNILSLPTPVNNVSTTLDDQSTDITIPSTAGINVGFIVSQVSGTGSIDTSVVVTSVVDSTTITLSSVPLTSGSAVLNFIPPFGTGTTLFSYEIGDLGVIDTVTIVDGGNGYNDGDILSVNAFNITQPITRSVEVLDVQELTFVGTLPSATFSVGDIVKLQDGDVTNVDVPSSSSTIPGQANVTYNNVPSSTNGSGSGATFTVIRDSNGAVLVVTVVDGGKGYSIGDNITLLGSDVGGTNGPDNIVVPVLSIFENNNTSEVYDVSLINGNISSILIESLFLNAGDVIVKSGSSTPYTINTTTFGDFRYIIDGSLTPNLTFYVGNTYVFDLSDSSNSSHTFALSEFPDGSFSPSLIENINTVLSNSSTQITVADTSNIIEGMVVNVVSGTGALNANSQTFVSSVDSATQLTLSEIPFNSGPVVLSFSGFEYTNGVIRESNSVSISITENTPTLYYYCQMHPNVGGKDGEEASITIDPNNPKVFGNNLSILVTSVLSSDVITGNVDGDLTCINASVTELYSTNITNSTTIQTNSLQSSSVTTPNINSASSSLLIDVQNVNVNGNISLNNLFSVNSSTGNITTSGELSAINGININSKTFIRENIISSTSGINLQIQPSANQIVEILGTTALAIPTGTTLQRPSLSAGKGDGYIRFNTQTSQYEGYSVSNQTWSSLGGVRDIDGNTYILAELTAGANDNTLWFFNDNTNTLKLTTQFLDFRSVKKISSGKLGLPAFTLWAANSPVNVGDYIKYRNNLYEVTGAGTTAPSGSEPSHTSGVANNGTAQFTWYSSAVSPLEFTEVEELRVGPNKDCPLIISQEIKILDNVISTLVQDLVLTPNSGKKVSIDAPTSLVIPVGNTNQRGSASQGSIRYNTTISQFEGYSGSNWSSLGGVRDVDGNTYIIPETAPAANENILYFYNDGTNTLQLSSTGLDFTNIDTITTSGGNSLALNTEVVTLDNSATTIDNTDSTSTFISTTKQYLDLGLSAGLTVDPVLRLDDQGDVYLNTGFGTGTFNGVKIFDGDLKDFELADYAVKTDILSLVKGTSNSGAVILYDTAAAKGCKVTVVSKSSAGKKSMVEYSVIDNGTDIFHNEFGSLNTSLDGFTAVFDITPGNETRITLTLSNDHATNDTVEITVLTQVVK